MKILVAGGFEAGSPKAHAINTVKMAQGFKRLGHDVTVLCFQSAEGEVSSSELAKIYGLRDRLTWIQLRRQQLGVTLNKHWGFAIAALPTLLQWQPDLVYARSYVLPWLSSRLGFTTVAEKHTAVGNYSPPFRWLVRATQSEAFALWVTISRRLADYYYQRGTAKGKIIVLPDAVDLELFQRPTPLPPSPYRTAGIHVAYVGHLYDYKGIPTILAAAARLPDIQFHLIGGLQEDIHRQQMRLSDLQLTNVTLHGLKPQVEIPAFLWHADLLLLPPSQHHASAAWTSPVKLAEYLASETPVIASDILALRDWVTEDEVKFFEPDSADALAASIQYLNQHPEEAKQLQQNGLKKAQKLTYKSRAKAILFRCRLHPQTEQSSSVAVPIS